MKSIFKHIILLSVLASIIGFQSIFASDSFTDVSATHTNIDAIEYLKKYNIVGGYPDGSYKPENLINRAEFSKIIVGTYFDQKEIDGCTESPFWDVPSGQWFTPYICLAKKKEIVQGYSDGSFKPTQNITFVEASKIVVKAWYLGGLGMTYDTEARTDEYWFKPYVDTIDRYNVIPKSILKFDQKITRGEMAEIIYRIQNKPTKPANHYGHLMYHTFYKPDIKLDLGAPADAIEMSSRDFKAELNKTYIITMNTASKEGEGCNYVDLNNLKDTEATSGMKLIASQYLDECVSIDTPLGFRYNLAMGSAPEEKNPVKLSFTLNATSAKGTGASPISPPFDIKIISIDKEIVEVPLAAFITITNADTFYNFINNKGLCEDLQMEDVTTEYELYTSFRGGLKSAVHQIYDPKCEDKCLEREACILNQLKGILFIHYTYEFGPQMYTEERAKAFKNKSSGGVSITNFNNRLIFLMLGCVARYYPVNFISNTTIGTYCLGTLPDLDE